jgi:hypothetical protein
MAMARPQAPKLFKCRGWVTVHDFSTQASYAAPFPCAFSAPNGEEAQALSARLVSDPPSEFVFSAYDGTKVQEKHGENAASTKSYGATGAIQKSACSKPT